MSVDMEHAALVALLQTRPNKLSWRELTEKVRICGSANAVWDSCLPPTLLPATDESAPLKLAVDELRAWHRAGLTFVSVLDDTYPARLRDVLDIPPFVFARGSLVSNDIAVAVVGSRNASSRGTTLATTITEHLISVGLTVVSGLAAGIDAAAHHAALARGGRTVAFTATGLNQAYPAANRELQGAIAARGLLLSQFWPDAPPQKPNFLKRNALIASYSQACIVVEAGENSGARNLATHAMNQGRPLILTDLVTRTNTWAQQLIPQPGVHPVASLDELADVLSRIMSCDGDLANGGFG